MVDKLGLSYHNVQALHKKLDTMPEKAGEWKIRSLQFGDKPDEKYIIRYRNPLEAIKTLWKDPYLSPQMQFKPQKIFSNSDRDARIYNEMWTGQWWHILQVGYNLFSRV